MRLAIRAGRHAFAAQNAVVDREVGDGVDKDLAVANKKTPPSEDGGASVEAVSRVRRLGVNEVGSVERPR
jgi:hypothetical protein